MGKYEDLLGKTVFLLKKLKKDRYSVLFDTTNGCNLRCTFCSRNNDRITQMSVEEFDSILNKVHKNVNALQLSCAWEYSIANNAAEIIRTLGRYSLPQTTIYTNGNILTDDIAKAMIEAEINDFVVSIGEVKKETYERLRVGGKFDCVVSNIRKLENFKKEHRSQFPRICANLTVVNSNIGELIEFVDLAYSVGIERIIGRHLILNEGLDMEKEMVTDISLANSIINTADNKALKYGMSFSIPKYEESFQAKTCRAPWHQLYVSSNGDVSVCPRIHMYEKMGNLLTDNFSRILKGREMRSLKQQFDNLHFNNPVCGICMENCETKQAIDQGF
ncbi:MAG: radical SAM protein [Desulfuromonadales bacterium]|nr:radical SAM protein [Desulfuromonadales bacterium]